jgi:homoserine O-acetyltransferase
MLLPTSKVFKSTDFPLKGGPVLEQLELAYETWGRLAPDGGNAILLCHGFTSSPHAAGDDAGWWSGLIGPGKAIDTDRFFVVCSNMLGSAYGSTGPASTDPRTGRPYGPDFPEITTKDIIGAQALLLDHLKIGRLAAVVGFSYGGYLTFEWGVTYPERMRALVPVATAIKGRGDDASVRTLRDRFAQCPGWNGGHYYDRKKESGVFDALLQQRIETLTGYGVVQQLEATVPDPAERVRRMHAMAAQWAEEFDAHSLIALRRAAVWFDARPGAANIKAPVLYALSRSDALFPPAIAPDTIALLKKAGVDARYVEIDSDYGHRGPGVDWQKWAPELKAFLAAREDITPRISPFASR